MRSDLNRRRLYLTRPTNAQLEAGNANIPTGTQIGVMHRYALTDIVPKL
jgi:hypothetical protein